MNHRYRFIDPKEWTNVRPKRMNQGIVPMSLLHHLIDAIKLSTLSILTLPASSPLSASFIAESVVSKTLLRCSKMEGLSICKVIVVISPNIYISDYYSVVGAHCFAPLRQFPLAKIRFFTINTKLSLRFLYEKCKSIIGTGTFTRKSELTWYLLSDTTGILWSATGGILWPILSAIPNFYGFVWKNEYSYLCCSNKEPFAACPDFWMKKHGEKFGYVAEIL